MKENIIIILLFGIWIFLGFISDDLDKLNKFGHVVHFCENGYMMAESYHGLSYDIKDGHFVECVK